MRIIFLVRRLEDEKKTPSSRLVGLVFRLGINATALWLASRWVSGIEIDSWKALLGAAAIFGLVNALIRPVVMRLGCPLTCLTLGLFTLVINAAMLALTAWFSRLARPRGAHRWVLGGVAAQHLRGEAH